MYRKALTLLTPLALLIGCEADSTTPLEPMNDAQLTAQFSKTAVGGRAGALGVVYVSSQGLYYDTFVSASVLPMKGRFQKLENGVTAYGPGDPGYLGGRWWVDANGDGMQNEGDVFLLCPLLPPGRATP
jgi:hypothetical protein